MEINRIQRLIIIKELENTENTLKISNISSDQEFKYLKIRIWVLGNFVPNIFSVNIFAVRTLVVN